MSDTTGTGGAYIIEDYFYLVYFLKSCCGFSNWNLLVVVVYRYRGLLNIPAVWNYRSPNCYVNNNQTANVVKHAIPYQT